MAPAMVLGTTHSPMGIRILDYFCNRRGLIFITGFNPLFSTRIQYPVLKMGINASEDGQSTSLYLEKESKEGQLIGFEENGRIVSEKEGEGKDKKLKAESDFNGLELLEDDLSWEVQSAKDYMDRSKEFDRQDSGPPRWFTPIECGRPMKDSPVFLFLPGIGGTGLGLMRHHQALGRIFDVRCMHIPIYDRTPFEGLVKFVEDTVRLEHALSPDRPIYLLGDSFGGCLALAVASRNPAIDLVLILSNPATSFGKSQLQPLLPLIEAVPAGPHSAIPHFLSTIRGDLVKMAMVDVAEGLSLPDMVAQLSDGLVALLLRLSVALSKIISKGTLVWKLKLLKSASSYANSRLHAVKAEVLVLASGKDQILPSMEEAERLRNTLPNCNVRFFKDSGHVILLEDGINLLTIIKGAQVYRRSRIRDFVSDFLPPTLSEFKRIYDQQNGWFRQAVNAVMLSTMKDGTIVRGLAGIPDEGPVLFVGYHMLLGLELYSLIGAILREKKILVRGLGHPLLFTKFSESYFIDPPFDTIRNFGAVPVSPSNLFKLLSRKAHVLMYPGGVREALHRKGEEYKLFWPERLEFVRMAAKFGATIVPFGVVGEDDIIELVVDYNDLMSFPPARDWIKLQDTKIIRLRTDLTGEVANQDVHLPGLLPKIPGRFYYLFGTPIETREKKDEFRDKEEAHKLYLYLKSEVENIMSYLRKKREEDPYRSLLPRALYQATWGFTKEVPTFEL
ncbi:acyltransferase-like protein At1g54570, chloroplastic isoform X2 [Amborella trichopoda]|nr:acyltransferase-like protein At1g54570, chloroplastic isoform X2 [Amborella trichopoda]|eukprot:XP_006855419.2 acyltransferase-like protein At1g54570, chloroplastic isoform X2 [Amborella trichopoda]